MKDIQPKDVNNMPDNSNAYTGSGHYDIFSEQFDDVYFFDNHRGNRNNRNNAPDLNGDDLRGGFTGNMGTGMENMAPPYPAETVPHENGVKDQHVSNGQNGQDEQFAQDVQNAQNTQNVQPLNNYSSAVPAVENLQHPVNDGSQAAGNKAAENKGTDTYGSTPSDTYGSTPSDTGGIKSGVSGTPAAAEKQKTKEKNERKKRSASQGIYSQNLFRSSRRPAVFPGKEAVVRKPDSNITFIMLAVIAIASVLSLFSMKSYIHMDTQTQSMSWMNIYNNNIHNLTSEILSDAVFIKKEYVIPENALSGAEPDPEGYHVNTEGSVGQAIDDALVYGLMQSPDMVYSEELELWNDQPAEYYIDETIFSVLWKESLYGCTVNFSEVFIADPSQMRRKLSQNQYGSPVHMLTSALADSTNAVTAMSGDFYGYRTMGCTVYQRKVYRSVVQNLDVCFIDSNGDFILKHYGAKEKISEKEMQKYVDDNDIIFSLSFGPNLIVDGQPQPVNNNYPLGQPDGHYARAAIAQMGSLHYLLCTIDGGVDNEVGTNVATLARIMADKNCLNAYTMDGGQTATIYFNKKVFNRVGYGSQRNISDIIYFASALGGAAYPSADGMK